MSNAGILESTQAVAATPVTAESKAALAELLDGDEIVELTIKPSPWHVAIISAPFVAVLATLTAAVAAIGLNLGWSAPVSLAFNAGVVAILARVAFASLQWASRLYVLTNRRVMHFRGVFLVRVSALPLARVSEAALRARWYEAALRLGSIRISSLDPHGRCVNWVHVARAPEIHELLTRAIRKAQ